MDDESFSHDSGVEWPASGTVCEPEEAPAADVRSSALPQPTPGYCAVTHGGWEGDCERGDSGSWEPHHHGLRDLAACVERCRRCVRCRYVSFKPREDCSWFHTCQLPLQTEYGGFTSVEVRVDAAPTPSS